MEKRASFASLPPPGGSDAQRRQPQLAGFVKSLTTSVLLACFLYTTVSIFAPERLAGGRVNEPLAFESGCPQADVLLPSKHNELWTNLTHQIASDDFRQAAVGWLSGAVQIPTESFDDLGPVGEDPRWEVFKPFHEYLRAAFPWVHTILKRTEVNTYGLIYEWIAEDNLPKPILLAAHQDVVPVEATTVDKWTHPPFSGHYDGKRIWGRGSSDDKSSLIAVLGAVETLLKNGFQPKRTLVLAFGFDEESSGMQGAGELAKVLEEKYGQDGIALIVDEGAGISEQFGTYIAAPGIAEKGFINVQVEVRAPGGHSSVPPAHTSIGILSALLVHFEKNPFKVHLSRSQPLYATLQCIGEHAKDVPKNLRNVIQKSTRSYKAMKKLEDIVLKDNLLKSLVGSTQAIDIIHGGVKSNALPEIALAVVNHRISVTSSVAELKQRDTNLLTPIARKFNLSYAAFGAQITEDGAPARGSLVLSDLSLGGLEPAPVTPTGPDAFPFKLLSGTIKAAFNSYRGDLDSDASEVVVAPGMMSGNTDTKYYWNLTQHIYRYSHLNEGKNDNPLSRGIHTVNEYVEVDAWLEMIQFYVTLILNGDESLEL